MLSIADREMDIYNGRLCLLYPDGAAGLRILHDGFVGDHRMGHSHTVTWDFIDPGIADSRTLSECYNCMCLMTLFRTVMYCIWPIIGLSGLYGLGMLRCLADPWPGGNSIYRGYIHPILWIGCMLLRRRSK